MLLARMEAASGVVLYRSPILMEWGVEHAFSTRIGGVSTGPFSSLNLGGGADQADHIATNFRRFAEAAGCGEKIVRRLSQVHGKSVVWADVAAGSATLPAADGILSDDSRFAICVRTADCVPVLMASEDGEVVAAVHAGWRGIVKGIVPAAIEAMRARVGKGKDFRAAVGPSIGVEKFEVGLEVMAEFEAVLGARAPIIRNPGAKPHIDLRRAIHLQLRDCGLGEDQIDHIDRCTYRDRDEFFSHRRDNGITGQMAAIISCRPAV